MRAPRRSTDDDPACQQPIVRILVIVKAARTNGDEISGLPHLSRLQEPDLIDLGTEIVVRVGIRRHVMPARIVVDEEDARSRWDDQLRRRDRAAPGDRNPVRILRRG